MGLDVVELVIATEEAFQIAIPDEAAEKILTPRELVDYVCSRIGGDLRALCLEQRAFYRLRAATMRVFKTQREAVRPDTPWLALMPKRQRRHNWSLLHLAAGTAEWPNLTILGRIPASVSTVGGAARYLARTAEASLYGATPWSRVQVEATIKRLICRQLGIETFGWDQSFVKDLGMG